MMTNPPLLAGAVNVTEAWVLPRVAVPMVGAPGFVAGMIGLVLADDAPMPTALVARTVHI